MQKQILKFLYIVIVAVLIIISFEFFFTVPLEQKKLVINNQPLTVEVVKSTADMERGLSRRPSLCQNCGMLFKYPDYQIRYFWMKDMEFPLDILWIKDDVVTGIQENIPIFDSTGQISQMQSPYPVNRILEVNSAWISQNKVKIGDKITGL